MIKKQLTIKHFLLILLTFWGCTTTSAWAEKKIFVSPKGNDRAEGTLTHPLRSILQKEREKKIALGHKADDHEDEVSYDWQQTM